MIRNMKSFTKIFMALAALSFAASCQVVEVYKPDYKPGTPDSEDCQYVYFPSQDLSSYAYLSPDAETSVTIKIKRENTEEGVKVPLKIKASEENIFTLAAPVVFEPNQAETEFTVLFPNAQIGTKYTATFYVDDPEFVSKYAALATGIDFTTMRVQWLYLLDDSGKPAEFTFEQGWWEETHYGKVKYYEIDGVRYCETETEDVDGFFGLEDGEISFVWYPSVKTLDDKEAVWLQPHNLGDAAGYGVDVYWWDWWSWWTICNPQTVFQGKDFKYFVENYSDTYPVSWYDNGAFYFHTAYYYMDGVGGWKQDAVETYLIADGFTRIDYSLEVETEYSYEGVIPFYVQAGVDVANVKVAGFEGKIDDKAVAKVAEQMASGEIESDGVELDEDNWGYAELEFESTGYYTLVAIGLNSKDELVSSASLQAFYVSADEEEQEKYKVKAIVGLEAVPARYEMDEYTTAAFYIQGHDIVECHMGLFETSISSLTESEIAQILGSVVYDTAGKYTLNAAAIEAINGEGGLYDYFTGLKDGKTYSLVVWLTNGSLDTILVDEYTTPKVPYEWNLLGDGTFHETLSMLWYKEPVPFDIPVKVYQEKNHPGIYKFDGNMLPFVSKIYGQDMTRYKGRYWKDFEIIFNAENPKKVTIDEQEIGVYTSSDGWITIATQIGSSVVGYGVFADGHLTLADKQYVWGCDQYYYGSDGFDLEMPSASSTPSQQLIDSYPIKSGVPTVSMPKNCVEAIPDVQRGIYTHSENSVKIEREVKQANVKVVTSAAPAQKKPSKVNGKSSKIAPSRATESIVK